MIARALRALPLDRRDAPPAAFGLLGAGLTLAREATYGAVLHWDSINYASVASSLAAGEGFTEFGGEPLAAWPPLYPLLLAAPALAGAAPIGAAGPINAALAGLAIFAGARWLARRLEARWLALWGGLALALAAPLAWTASWALSEPLFVLLTLLALMRAEAHLREGDAPALRQAAALTALACLTRWAGVAIAAAVIPLLVLQPGGALTERLRRAALYAAIALVPLGLWMARNLWLTGEAIAYSQPTDTPPGEIAAAILGVAGRWLAPGPTAEPAGLVPRALAAALLIALAAAVAVLAARRGCEPWRRRAAFLVFGGFAVAYLACYAAGARGSSYVVTTAFHRYLAPALPALLLATALGLDALLALARERAAASGAALAAPRLLALAAAAPLALWLAWNLPEHARAVGEANGEGVVRESYSNARWAGSATLARLREAPPRGWLWTNVPAAVYAFADGGASHRYLGVGHECLRAQVAWASGGDRVVWFRGWYANAGFGYGLGDLRRLPGLEAVADLEDGVVFRVRDRAGGGPPPAAPPGEQPFPSAFDAYLGEAPLTYARRPCRIGDLERRFYLHLIPERPP